MEAIRKDFDEAAEKLHKTNRYRHELELRYQAEKLTQERLRKTLLDKEAIVEEQNKKIVGLNEKMVTRDRRILGLLAEVKDIKDDRDTKINQFSETIHELKQQVDKERLQVQEWSDECTKVEA